VVPGPPVCCSRILNEELGLPPSSSSMVNVFMSAYTALRNHRAGRGWVPLAFHLLKLPHLWPHIDPNYQCYELVS
jgi:hypothetical protein